MKRRLLLKLGPVALLGAGLFVAWLWCTTPRHRITEPTYARIKDGMTTSEVCSVFGVGPGDYSSDPTDPRHSPYMTEFVVGGIKGVPTGAIAPSKTWLSDNGAAIIHFNDEGVVVLHTWEPIEVDGLLNRFKRWLSVVMGR